jgi:hypothetical protein
MHLPKLTVIVSSSKGFAMGQLREREEDELYMRDRSLSVF